MQHAWINGTDEQLCAHSPGVLEKSPRQQLQLPPQQDPPPVNTPSSSIGGYLSLGVPES